MINPIHSQPIVLPVPGGTAGARGHPAGLPEHIAPVPAVVQPVTVSMSAQALSGLASEGLAVALNAPAAGPPVGGLIGGAPPLASASLGQIQAAAQNATGNSGFFNNLIEAMGGPYFVAASMSAQQGAALIEAFDGAVAPTAPIGGGR